MASTPSAKSGGVGNGEVIVRENRINAHRQKLLRLLGIIGPEHVHAESRCMGTVDGVLIEVRLEQLNHLASVLDGTIDNIGPLQGASAIAHASRDIWSEPRQLFLKRAA